MSAEIVDLHPRRPVPTLRWTQEDAEALRKLQNIIEMVDRQYLTVAEAWPWLKLELRRTKGSEVAS